MNGKREMIDSTMQADVKELLQQRFGFADFRPGQEEAISLLLGEGRVLCIQPTGYGKSLIYQLPSLLFEGITLVISPLLALMRDQIQQLNNRFQVPAASINSDQSLEENGAAMAAAREKRIRILFIAPEKLDNLEIVAFLAGLDVALIVVDEAHCISTWGHDFRPSYRQIVQAIRSFEARNGELRVLGLTATANERTEQDIVSQLAGPEGAPFPVLRMPMDRPNIRLGVIPAADMAEKLAQLATLLGKLEGNGILYCATREHTEIAAGFLSDQGLDVIAYHAGMPADRKRELQQLFMSGKHKAIAATNALGMGIDKEDIRFIVHVDIPGSITAYYQEVGRAGRDGLPAEGILLFDASDRRIQDHFIRSAQPTSADFINMLNHIEPDAEGMWPNLTTLKVRTGLHPTRVTVIMAELAEQGFVEKQLIQRKQVYVRTDKDTAPDLSRYERQYQVRTGELEAMLRYANGEVACLMQALRRALGDVDAPKCGRCSRCRSNALLEIGGSTGRAQNWLGGREVPIAPSRRPLMSSGLAALNGEQRSPAYVQFMRQRTAAAPEGRLAPELQEHIKKNVLKLQERYALAAVLALPSRTWQQREETANYIAGLLGIRAFPDLLAWRELPDARQGELLNNDQRRHNVMGKMGLTGLLIRPGAPPPSKGILLLDDYVGSGVTMKEGVRALREEGGFTADIVPFAVARVRWRIGARGMI